MDLLFFVLSSYGLTQILCYGKIFDKWRPTSGKLGELFSCSMCTGFWVGLFLGGIEPFTQLFSLSANFVDIFLLGCTSSGTSYILDKVVGDDGIKIHKRWSR
jgi:hypothetical protein